MKMPTKRTNAEHVAVCRVDATEGFDREGVCLHRLPAPVQDQARQNREVRLYSGAPRGGEDGASKAICVPSLIFDRDPPCVFQIASQCSTVILFYCVSRVGWSLSTQCKILFPRLAPPTASVWPYTKGGGCP